MGESERGEPLNLCGAELEKAASQRKSDALLTLLICFYYFPGEKKDLTKKLQRGLVPVSTNERGISFIITI